MGTTTEDLTAIRGGSHAAREQFFARMLVDPRVINYARRLLRRNAKASQNGARATDDFVQEGLTDPTLTAAQSSGGWFSLLRRRMRSDVVDSTRKGGKRLVRVDNDGDQANDRVSDPVETACIREALGRLETEMPNAFIAFLAVEIEGRTRAEVAASNHLSVSRIQRAVESAKERLREYLRD